MNFVCRLDKSIYSCVTDDITTDEVVLTAERVEHIKSRHPNDFEKYFGYAKRIIEEPDYILEDRASTALILKEFVREGEYFRLVLRLRTSADNPDYKNSILTFMKTNVKKWKQNINNKKILYKRSEL